MYKIMIIIDGILFMLGYLVAAFAKNPARKIEGLALMGFFGTLLIVHSNSI